MNFDVIIPARYASSRFPGKILADIKGKPMIQHVHERAVESGADRVIVATDDQRIADVVTAFGGTVCMTDSQHQSGTERLAEVVEKLDIAAQRIIVNVQGDEPFIPAQNIRQVASNLAPRRTLQMATLAVKISSVEEALNPNAVKVVVNSASNALYFSRATIPYDRERFLGQEQITEISDTYLRHIGIYAYRAGFIQRYVKLAPSPLEQLESLEQLRVIWHGESIHVAIAQQPPPVGIDTPEDLEALLASGDL